MEQIGDRTLGRVFMRTVLVAGLALVVVGAWYGSALAARSTAGGGGGKAKTCRPSAEVCDGKDNDCNTLVDDGGVCNVTYYCDADKDAYPSKVASGSCTTFGCVPMGCTSKLGTDCNDANAKINPAVVENCNPDGIDNDCDGVVDECDPCANGVKDGTETAVDCGGSCPGCDLGQACNSDADCISSYCPAGTCAQPPTPLAPDCNAIKYDDGVIPNHVNLVLVPSGFNGDMGLFQQKAQWIAAIFDNYVPFGSSIPEYNVFYVTKEAGDYCYFNCQGIARLLCCDTGIARNLSSTCTTGSRQTIVVENNGTYGGAGYTSSDVATTSINSSAPLVAVHEIGHSLFNLGDEYTSGTSTAGYPNCDYTGCAKWQDMLGFNGVSCTSGNCASGSYFASENTMMKALNYQFEEVNERISCCTYGLETGTYPPYCDKFKQFTSTGDLSQFCQNPNGAGAAPVPSEYLEDPEEITFSRDGASGEWQVDSATRRRPGFYPTSEARGDGAGPIRVDVGFANGHTQQLRFTTDEDVEFPGAGNQLGGTTRMPRNVLTVVVDRKGRGAVTSMQAREEHGLGNK